MGTINRRTFLGTTSAVLTAAHLGHAAQEKIKTGLIGCGWYGMVDTKAALKTEAMEMVAVCDVDSEHRNNATDEIEKLQGQRPKEYKDYRELLEQSDLDAVIIATPPQWHALPFIAACEKGVDIYCEKPMAYDIREGRAMVNAAKKAGRIVQFGFQRRQSAAYQAAAAFVQAGKAGEIKQVEAQINYGPGRKDPTPKDPPASLDWDMWCGPSPLLPYAECRGHFNWRLEKHTGHGHLVDWGIHLIDAVRVTLKESTPKKIQAHGGLYYLGDWINTPDILSVNFAFDTCPVIWSHRMWGAVEYNPNIKNGVLFYGTDATVFATDRSWEVVPKKGEKQVYQAKTEGGAGYLHMLDFVKAVHTRNQPNCLPLDAFHSTATVQLGMIAYETDTTVRWDEPSEQIINNPQVAKLLKRDYRKPYKHPYST